MDTKWFKYMLLLAKKRQKNMKSCFKCCLTPIILKIFYNDVYCCLQKCKLYMIHTKTIPHTLRNAFYIISMVPFQNPFTINNNISEDS